MMKTVHGMITIVLASIGIAGAANAMPIVGGDTRVLVDTQFAGLVGGVTGLATVFSADPLIANFPISGGSLDASLAGTIRHDGVGLILTDGMSSVEAANFVINTTSQLLFGDVSVDGMLFANDVPLFSFDLSTVTVEQLTNLANPLLGLFITADAAGALTAVFGVPDLTGVQFGAAATAPVMGVIPEVGTWAMMIAGFGLVGASMRQRRRMVAA